MPRIEARVQDQTTPALWLCAVTSRFARMPGLWPPSPGARCGRTGAETNTPDRRSADNRFYGFCKALQPFRPEEFARFARSWILKRHPELVGRALPESS